MECDVGREEFEAASKAAVQCLRLTTAFVERFGGDGSRVEKATFYRIQIPFLSADQPDEKSPYRILQDVKTTCLAAEAVCNRLGPQLRAACRRLGKWPPKITGSAEVLAPYEYEPLEPLIPLACTAGSNHELVCLAARLLWNMASMRVFGGIRAARATFTRSPPPKPSKPFDVFDIDLNAFSPKADDVWRAMRAFPTFDRDMLIQLILAEGDAVLKTLPRIEGSPPASPVEPELGSEWRDGNRIGGELLTTEYIARDETFGLKGPYVTKNFGPGKALTKREKHGRTHVYLFKEIAALSAQRTKRTERDDS